MKWGGVKRQQVYILNFAKLLFKQKPPVDGCSTVNLFGCSANASLPSKNPCSGSYSQVFSSHYQAHVSESLTLSCSVAYWFTLLQASTEAVRVLFHLSVIKADLCHLRLT